MDVADIAEKWDSCILQHSIQEIRRKAKSEHLLVTGTCYNCGEPCEGLFCDEDCRKDYEKLISAQKRNGKQK